MGTTISYFLNLQIQRNFLAFKNIHGKKSKKYVTFYRLVHSGANNLPSRIHFSLSLRSYLAVTDAFQRRRRAAVEMRT